jgi:hypothetical protein
MLIRTFLFFFWFGELHSELCSSILNTLHILEITIYAVGQCSRIYDLFNDASNVSDFTVPTFDMTKILRNKLVQSSLLFCSPRQNSLTLVASIYSQHLNATAWIQISIESVRKENLTATISSELHIVCILAT